MTEAEEAGENCRVKGLGLGGPSRPVIVTIRDILDYIRVPVYSYYTTITGWGRGPPKFSGGIVAKLLGGWYTITPYQTQKEIANEALGMACDNPQDCGEIIKERLGMS